MVRRSALAIPILALLQTGALAQQASPPFQPSTDQGLFLIVTDIHFDPFTDASLVPQLDQSPVSDWSSIFTRGTGGIQGYGKDAGHDLMVSAFNAAAALGLTYDYVLYTGDYLSHGFNEKYQATAGPSPQGVEPFAVKTAQYVSRLIGETFDDIPVFGVLGNTDSACGDYEIAPGGAFLAGLQEQWAALSHQPTRFHDFPQGGAYKTAHPTLADTDLIALNNIFWTPRYSDRCNPDGGDPGAQMMSWLEQQIADTHKAGRKAQLLLHVPPGINAYSTTHGKGTCDATISPFWRAPFPSDFQQLMQRYAGVVTYSFSGHTHMDSFAVIADGDGAPLIASQITPAVSPIFGNNPAFAVFLYDRTSGDIDDSATYYLSNLAGAATGEDPIWQLEYRYRDTFSLADLSPASRASLAARIKTDEAVRTRFSTLYTVSATDGPVTASNWKAYACAQSAIGRDAYKTCYCDSD
ncbi:metallophosphoesterase [Labrenzia sp. VG12]|uniref:metallophosphoesterase n=1 Tax=Labrenzia sp. VG12 TaxID=2021862 RepID=UPI000B8C0A86|nr:metallophosphoesterase [Labrenzia sp. VG12]ASP32109.1 hypothetical protein CHH27_01710 [Labrenzia sp. VG12]